MLRLGLRFAPAAATPPGVRVRHVKLPRTNRAMRLVTSISANCPATSAISRQAQTAVFRDLSGSLRATGVTPGEFSLLAMLRANPDINSITLATHQATRRRFRSRSRLASAASLSSPGADDRRYYSCG